MEKREAPSATLISESGEAGTVLTQDFFYFCNRSQGLGFLAAQLYRKTSKILREEEKRVPQTVSATFTSRFRKVSRIHIVYFWHNLLSPNTYSVCLNRDRQWDIW